MAEHPPTSIYIEPERKYDESKIANSITGSIKSTVVAPQNKYQSVFPSGDTTPLQNQPNLKQPKNTSNK